MSRAAEAIRHTHRLTSHTLARAEITAKKRYVGDPTVYNEAGRAACLYGAAMMRKVGRLPTDMTAIDVQFCPPATLIFVAADGSQREVGRYVIPDRVMTYDPKPQLMPPEGE